MKQKYFTFIISSLCLVCNLNVFAQKGITSINTTSVNLQVQDTISNRHGAGVQSSIHGLSDRWDSAGSNFKLVFNAGNSDSLFITDASITGSTGNRLQIPTIAKVRRVSNSAVQNNGNHFSFWAASNSAPLPTENTGIFSINAPDLATMEAGLVSNNINTGFDNVFQNTSVNVHYGNVERIDYIFPNGITTNESVSLSKIGFIIYVYGAGNPFNIAGISNLDLQKDPSDYSLPLVSVSGSDFGNDLLPTEQSFVIFQKDPLFYGSETRPSARRIANIKGVFISLAELGFTTGQKVYGFSLFANDVPANSTVAALLDFNSFPTNTNSNNMLDLVNSVGLYSFNQTVLSSPVLLRASVQNLSVVLEWNNESIVNAKKAILQRAGNNMIYYDLKEISSNQIAYTDLSLRTDISYYRLKVFEKNGGIKYSNIQYVNSNKKKAQIFPTVTNDMLYINAQNLKIDKPFTISIYNLDGKLVQTYNPKASSFINLNVSNLQKGMFVIVVAQNNETIISERFQKN